MAPRGALFILSAPSGGGKTTLAQAIIARTPGVTRVLTYTTRPPRLGEQDGRDYHFISSGEFEQRREGGEFLEWASVHGYLYGTSHQDVAGLRDQGLDVLLVIDYQGAASLRKQEVDALSIFILPPSMEELEQRLRQRNSEDEAELRRRLAVARQEMAQYRFYDYIIVNDDLGGATANLRAIILAERCRLGRLHRDRPIFAQLDGETVHRAGRRDRTAG